jgi:hypothetical protein
MKAPDTIVIEGRAYSWRVILELRRAQIEGWKAAQLRQPALFELALDHRPRCERTAAGRFCEPSLLSFLHDAAE